jgi:hypothetical protein
MTANGSCDRFIQRRALRVLVMNASEAIDFCIVGKDYTFLGFYDAI